MKTIEEIKAELDKARAELSEALKEFEKIQKKHVAKRNKLDKYIKELSSELEMAKAVEFLEGKTRFFISNKVLGIADNPNRIHFSGSDLIIVTSPRVGVNGNTRFAEFDCIRFIKGNTVFEDGVTGLTITQSSVVATTLKYDYTNVSREKFMEIYQQWNAEFRRFMKLTIGETKELTEMLNLPLPKAD